MNPNTTQSNSQETQANPTTPEVAPELRERVPLGDVLRQIAEDASDEPKVYLTETTVPHGGE